MPTVHHVKKARKNNRAAGIRKGQEYWWAGYRLGWNSYKRFWKSPPRASQVAASDYVANVLSIFEEMDDAKPKDASELEEMRDDWVDDIREIAEECRDKFENLPEGFQQGDTGQLLEERADAMDQWAADVECVDVDWDEKEDADNGVTWDDYARQLLDELASGSPE